MLLFCLSLCDVCIFGFWPHRRELSNMWNLPVLRFALRGTFWKQIRGRIPQIRPEAHDRPLLRAETQLQASGESTEWHINHASQSVSRNVFAPLNSNKQRAGDPDSDKDVKEPREREMGLFEPERVPVGRPWTLPRRIWPAFSPIQTRRQRWILL